MVSLLLTLIACAPEPASAPAPEPAPIAAAAPEDAPPPMGRIGGEPILPRPVVIGGIATSAVEEGIAAQMAGINHCYEVEREKDPKLAGKVLVKLTIAPDGSVKSTTTRSTSLRNQATEDCVNQQVALAKFPALSSGTLAIVNYPFVFPAQ